MEKIEAICYKAVIQKGKWKHLNDVVVRPIPNLFWSEVDAMIEGYNLGKNEGVSEIKDVPFPVRMVNDHISVSFESGILEIKGLKNETQETQEPKEDYEYEMFFNSEPSEPCQIHGWYPIATDRIRNPEKIEEYIQKGLLRKKSK